jgi:hypothetical protein
VFFNSPDPLVARDTNGEIDAYVWTRDEGARLLSSGKSPDPSRFIDASADGSRAFIATRDRLVGQDVDTNVDLYTASVDGGLAVQQAKVKPDCVGEACQGTGSSPPGVDDPASSRFHGTGDVAAGPRCTTLSRRAAAARRHAKELKRLARRASGQRAKRLKKRSRVAKKRAVRAQRRAAQCRRGGK